MPRTADLNAAVKDIIAEEVRVSMAQYLPLLDRLARFIGTAPARRPARPRRAAAAAPVARRTERKRVARAPKRSSRAESAPAKAPARPAKANQPKAVRGSTKRGGLVKPMQPDAALAEIVGASPVALSAVVKKVWAHIKDKGLQDPKNGRLINPDAKLAPVFGAKQISMFEITKLVSKHLS